MLSYLEMPQASGDSQFQITSYIDYTWLLIQSDATQGGAPISVKEIASGKPCDPRNAREKYFRNFIDLNHTTEEI